MKTIHHNLQKDSGGSDKKENKTYLDEGLHKALHIIFKTMPPHMSIERLLRIGCEGMKEEIKEEIMSIVNIPAPENLYKQGVIKDICKFKKNCFKYLWIKYFRV